jgi:hypothetical protein
MPGVRRQHQHNKKTQVAAPKDERVLTEEVSSSPSSTSFSVMKQPLLAIYACLGILLTLLAIPVQAQVPAFDWATGADAPTKYVQQAKAYGITTDAAGNSYVTGVFRDVLKLGSTTLTTTGDYDAYVACLDAAGNYRWAVQCGGYGSDFSTDIGLDASGNVYVTGYSESSDIRFGALTIPNSYSHTAVFVAKLSPTGSWLRATPATSINPAFLYMISTALVVDGPGNVYITGGFNGQPGFGSTTLTSYGGYSIFVAKLNTTGTWDWATQAGGFSYDFGYGIAIDGNSNVFVTGTFEAYQAVFGPIQLTKSNFSKDMFVAKLDPAGRWLWATHADAAAAATGNAITTDPAGNAYVTGALAGKTARLGTIALPKDDDSYDLLVAKLNPAGTWQWAVRGGSPREDGGTGIVRDAEGFLTVVGTVAGSSAVFGTLPPQPVNGAADVAVVQLDADGSWRWALCGGGPGEEYGAGIAAAPQGGVRIAGTFEGSSSMLGATTLPGGTLYYDFFADRSFVASVADLARRSPSATDLTLWPNPSHGTVWATGLEAGQPVQLFDAIGRLVVADAKPTNEALGLQLPALKAGIYFVRSGKQVRRLVVE